MKQKTDDAEIPGASHARGPTGGPVLCPISYGRSTGGSDPSGGPNGWKEQTEDGQACFVGGKNFAPTFENWIQDKVQEYQEILDKTKDPQAER